MRGRTAQAAASPSPEPYAGRLKGEKRLQQLARLPGAELRTGVTQPREAPPETFTLQRGRAVSSAGWPQRGCYPGDPREEGSPDGLTGSRHDGEFRGPCIRASVRKHKRGQ